MSAVCNCIYISYGASPVLNEMQFIGTRAFYKYAHAAESYGTPEDVPEVAAHLLHAFTVDMTFSVVIFSRTYLSTI
jgi:hypothetical protein